MDISTNLLVLIMFSIILSMGIGNLIGGLAGVVNRRSGFQSDRLHTTWIVILLLIHFSLFWHSLVILGIEDWEFAGFLFMMLGPILTFFAASVLLPDASDPDANDVRGHYFNVAPQFFILLALSQLWILGVDFGLGNGFTTPGTFNLAGAVLLFILSLSKSPGLHMGVTALVFILFVTSFSLKGLGIIG